MQLIKHAVPALALGMVLTLTGCSDKLYQVTDLDSGRVYTTNEVERLDDGVVRFETADGIVTIQESKVERVDRDD